MRTRRLVAGMLVVLGGVMLFLAPGTLGGLVLVGLGVLVEIVGIYLEHRRR